MNPDEEPIPTEGAGNEGSTSTEGAGNEGPAALGVRCSSIENKVKATRSLPYRVHELRLTTTISGR